MVLHEDGRLQVERIRLVVSGFHVGGAHDVSLFVVQVGVVETTLLEQRGRTIDVGAVEVSLVQQAEFNSGNNVFRSQFSADGVGAGLDQQRETLDAGQGFHAVGLGQGDTGVGVHEALEAHDVTQQGGDDFGVVSRTKLLDVDIMATVGLRDRADIRRVAGVARHDCAHACVNSSLEADQLVLFQRTGSRVQTPLTLRGVRLKAVFGSAVTGEVLRRQHDGLLVHAVLAILIAVHQRGDDAGGNVGTLAVSAAVPRPAGVGHQVDLRAIHEDDALRTPHLAVNLGIILDGVVVAVAQHRCRHAQRIREAGGNRVGDQRHRDCRRTRLGGIPFSKRSGYVVVQRNNRSVVVQTAAVHARANLANGHHLIVQAGERRGSRIQHNQALRGFAFGDDGHNLGGIDGAVFILDIRKRLGTGHNHQGVQDETSLFGQRHLRDHVRGAFFRRQTPVFERVQLVVVVGILEVQAILLDDTNGRHADGRAILVLIEHRLKVGLGGVNFFRIVGSRNVGCFGRRFRHCGNRRQQHRRCNRQAQNPFHAEGSPFPFSLPHAARNMRCW